MNYVTFVEHDGWFFDGEMWAAVAPESVSHRGLRRSISVHRVTDFYEAIDGDQRVTIVCFESGSGKAETPVHGTHDEVKALLDAASTLIALPS